MRVSGWRESPAARLSLGSLGHIVSAYSINIVARGEEIVYAEDGKRYCFENGLRRLTGVIQSLDTRSVDLVVLDADCLTEDTATQLFGGPNFTMGGWGETIWIRDGRVVARVLAHTAPESLMERYTRGLLDDNAA